MSQPAAPAEPAPAPRAALWHGLWLALGLVAAAVAALSQSVEPIAAAALAIGAYPGLAGLIPILRRGELGRTSLLALWALCTAFAMVLTGGLSGPLAAWALAPMAAGCLFGGRRILAAAAALSAASGAAVAMLEASHHVAAVSDAIHPWVGLYATTVLGLGFAAALIPGGARQAPAPRGAVGDLIDVLDAAPVLILRLDRAGRVRESFGRYPDGLDAESLAAGLTRLTDPPAIAEAQARAHAEGRSQVGFAPSIAPDRWFVIDYARRETELIAVLRDATLERSREAALEQAAADAEAQNAGKSTFLANMSHELRTPLNAIIGFSDIMRTQMFGPMTAKYAEYAGLIHESGGHLLDLINDVLDMSKIEAQRFDLAREEFDARDAVSAALRLLRVQADGAAISLRGVLPSVPLEADADRRALKQIVLNLVSNALKFTPAGGQITVTARAQGPILEIIVADTGVGISRADLERLGRPYEQAGETSQRIQGTGLGLSLVRAFAELHGGEMEIESALGEGTAVTVRLPVMVETPPDEAPTPHTGNVVAFNPQR